MRKINRVLLLSLFAILPGIAMPQAIGTPAYVSAPSDFPIIYTVGDARPMVAALNAIAMLFGGNDATANSFMGSGIGAMVIGSLVLMLASSVSKVQMQIGPWALSVLLTFALFYPKTTVKVSSYFDASGGSVGAAQLYFVDNVPIGLAIPAGVFGMIGQRLSAAFDTTFTSADAGGGFLALGTDGFAKPLRILLGARGAFSCTSNSNLCNNLLSYGRYCLHPASGVRANTSLLTKVDGISKFFSSQTTGTMIWWSENGDGAFAPCPYAGAALQDAMERYVTNANNSLPSGGQYRVNLSSSFAADLAARMGMQDATSESPGSSGGVGIDSSYNIISTWTQQLGATISADNNAIMMNLVFPPHIKAMIQSASSENAEATYQQILREGMEKARLDMAGEGSMFVNLSVSAMNLFTFLYIAFTPIIALVIAVMGAHSIKLVASYMVFGLWTQTWMPTAAIISYYAQTSFFSKMANLRHNGVLTPEHIDQFYQDLANTMATAGTFMAATPMITLSLLTGSIYGLVSLANKAGGSGATYLDENKAAPDVNKAANVDAIAKQVESMGVPFAGGARAPGGVGPASGPRAGYEALGEGSITIGSGSSSSVSAGSDLSSRLASERKASESARAAFSEKYGEQYKTSVEGSSGTEGGHAESVSTGGDQSFTSKHSVSDKSAYAQTTTGSTNVTAGAGMTANSGSGSRPGNPIEPKSGELVSGQHGPLAPGKTAIPQNGARQSGTGIPLPKPAGSANFSFDTNSQEQDQRGRTLSSQQDRGTASTLKTGHDSSDRSGQFSKTTAAGSVAKSAERAADEQRIRGLDRSVAEAAAAVQSAAIRNELSESMGTGTAVSLAALRSMAVDQGSAGAGKQPGIASGAAMLAAGGAIGKVAGTDARQAELQDGLQSRKSGYLQSGYNDDRATLAALRDMTLSGNADERAVGFKGIAAYASVVNDPSAKPLSDRADRAADNAQALSNATSALSKVAPADFGQVATNAGSAPAAITGAASSMGADEHHPAGDKVPTSGQVHRQANSVQQGAAAQIANVKQQVGAYLASGQKNEQAVKAGGEVMQRIANAENAGKIVELQKNPDFQRSWDAFKRAADF